MLEPIAARNDARNRAQNGRKRGHPPDGRGVDPVRERSDDIAGLARTGSAREFTTLLEIILLTS